MADIALPVHNPLVDIEWGLDVPKQRNRSAWTGRRKIVDLPGAAAWFATVKPPQIDDEDEKRDWRATMIGLLIGANTVRVPAPCPVQTTAANPNVRAGAGSGTALPLQGLPGSTTVLRKGDFLTIPLPSGHDRLVMLQAPLVTNGSGQGTATVYPEIGEVPVAGAVVEMREPYARMEFADPRQSWSDAYAVASFAFALQEAL